MSAQEQWKELYRQAHAALSAKTRDAYLGNAIRYRREAALERKLAAAERTIAAQAAELQHIRTMLDDGTNDNSNTALDMVKRLQAQCYEANRRLWYERM